MIFEEGGDTTKRGIGDKAKTRHKENRGEKQRKTESKIAKEDHT
jgi:hypothetical protein